ncbi:MAG: M23 family metallopeptidase, partial [Planctomycetota bacterium]
ACLHSSTSSGGNYLDTYRQSMAILRNWARDSLAFVLPLLLSCLSPRTPLGAQEKKPRAAASRTAFTWPCDQYLKGLRGKGNFGRLIPCKRGSVCSGTWHLAEDVWLPGGTPVRSVADGVVMYSDFSPTWIDARGRKHWNLGNVIVIEHRLVPAEGPLTHVCSFYVHLGKDRRVKRGDKVARGQRIGSIGADRSKENGLYPAHLHFGIHKGPYYQLSPAFRRQTLKEARTTGLPTTNQATGGMQLVRGKITNVELIDKTTADFHFENGKVSRLSLETASSSPDYKPADIMNWCTGYGDKATVAEWLRPSTWIKSHPALEGPRKR